MSERIYNYCPHDVNIHLKDGTVKTIPTSGELIAATRPHIGEGFYYGIPYKFYSGHSVNMRDMLGGKVNLHYGDSIIVSQIYAMALSKEEWREHFEHVSVFWPDTNPDSVVRDEKGMIVGVKGLTRWV